MISDWRLTIFELLITVFDFQPLTLGILFRNRINHLNFSTYKLPNKSTYQLINFSKNENIDGLSWQYMSFASCRGYYEGKVKEVWS
jgi:hypothetical protein